tara:strand:- start:1755 stop:2600 length:846 start_codon:yes stop_codon:yes gene_type:complete
MGLVDSDAISRIDSMLGHGDAPIDDTPVSSGENADAPEDAQQADSSDAPEDVKEEGEVSEDVEASFAEDVLDEGGTPSHKIPYKRFKQVLDSQKKSSSEVTKLHKELKALQEQVSGFQQQQQSPSAQEDFDLDSLLYGDDNSAGYSEASSDQYAQLSSRVEAFEVHQAEQELTREVSVARERYPNVPEEVIYEAVVRDPSAEVMYVAEQYSNFIAGIEEAAISRHMSTSQAVETAQATPRPRKSGSPPRSGIVHDQPKPTNVAEAKAAMANFLSKNNIFKR